MFILQQPTLMEKLDDIWPKWGVQDIFGVHWYWHKGSLIRNKVMMKHFLMEHTAATLKLNCKPGLYINKYKGQ